ncbi:MAG: LPS export ABC transporter periplasmic protein LptC [Nitrospirales bacterium]|nr:LPS export ABC transporter periplasmic protein LptC [Nitrospira sp.]MDR4500361.1 LPS export ABC transporter periplasmic protein LptC [Nitrospirales bacterium]
MKRSWGRWVLTSVVVAMSVFIIYRVVLHMEDRASQASIESSDEKPADAWINGFTYRQTQAGKTKWKVIAERAQVFESQHRANLEDVEVQLLGEKTGTTEMTVQAEKGTIDTATNNFDLDNEKDMMAVKLASGYTIFSTHLTWTEASRKITTQRPVVIRGHGLTITGKGLIGTIDNEEFQVLQDVQVELSS